MVGESDQIVFLIQIYASNFEEYELSKFEISRFEITFQTKTISATYYHIPRYQFRTNTTSKCIRV